MKLLVITLMCSSLIFSIGAIEPEHRQRPVVPRPLPISLQQQQIILNQRLQQKRQTELSNSQEVLKPVQGPVLGDAATVRAGPNQGQFNRPLPVQQKPLPQQQPSPVQPQRAVPLQPFGAGSIENPPRPLRQSPENRPVRPPPTEEFTRGFPEGFTNGLPSFNFQGRMPEPDAKSEGFMDSFGNFPSLKTLGGFDQMADIREDPSDSVKQINLNAGRPNRPIQPAFRPTAN